MAITTYCETWTGGQEECPSYIEIFKADSFRCVIQLSPFGQPKQVMLDTGSYTFVVSSIGQATLRQDIVVNDSLNDMRIHLRWGVRLLGIVSVCNPNFGPLNKKSTRKAIKKYDQANKEKWEAQRRDKILLRYKKAIGLGNSVKAEANF